MNYFRLLLGFIFFLVSIPIVIIFMRFTIGSNYFFDDKLVWLPSHSNRKAYYFAFEVFGNNIFSFYFWEDKIKNDIR